MVGESLRGQGTSLIIRDTKGFGEAGDDGEAGDSGDRMPRLLKPSEVFKKYGSGSHDLTNNRGSTPSVVSTCVQGWDRINTWLFLKTHNSFFPSDSCHPLIIKLRLGLKR